jgi:DNA polymerase-1
VTIWEIKSGQTTDVVGVKEKWGIEPIQLVDFLALQGDPADNIPGVRGIGPKKAVDLIQRFGCIESIYEKLHMVTGKLRDTLFEGKNMALLSKKLATIVRDAPIDTTLEDMIWRGPTMSKIVPLFNELGFRKHLATVQGNWR